MLPSCAHSAASLGPFLPLSSQMPTFRPAFIICCSSPPLSVHCYVLSANRGLVLCCVVSWQLRGAPPWPVASEPPPVPGEEPPHPGSERVSSIWAALLLSWIPGCGGSSHNGPLPRVCEAVQFKSLRKSPHAAPVYGYFLENLCVDCPCVVTLGVSRGGRGGPWGCEPPSLA